MTIPQLQVDKPLEIESLPGEPLMTRLPAHVKQTSSLNVSNFAFLAGSTALTAISGSVWLSYSSATSAASKLLVNNYEVLCLGWITLILIRPIVKSNSHSHFVAVTSVLAIAVILGQSTFDSIETLIVFASLAIQTAWVLEFASHYRHLHLELRELTPPSRQLDPQLDSLAKWFATLLVFQLVAISVFGMPLGIYLASIVALIGMAGTNLKMADLCKTIQSFLFYPTTTDPTTLPTVAGNMLSRAALVGCFLAIAAHHLIGHALQGELWLGLNWLIAECVTLAAITLLAASRLAGVAEIDDRVALWRGTVSRLRSSPNDIERNSVLLGYAATDLSPILVDRSLYRQHMHILGTTGANKSSMGVAPLLEQFVSFGDASVVVIDLKGDSPELYYGAEAAIQRYHPKMPLKYYSLENEKKTQGFNPFLTEGWMRLSPLERSDILCTCCGLAYGFEYGPGFFTAINSLVVTATTLANPDAMSFRQLNKELRRFMYEDTDELLPELRRAGIHSLEVIGRLASYDSLNITPERYSDEILLQQIELSRLFQEPGVAYFKLPSTTAALGAPAIARLVLFYLVIAAKAIESERQVYVIIDEFQRAASGNLDQILQLARSHNVSLIMANQSLGDLKANSESLFSAVASNCSIRQWFSVNSLFDIEMLEKLMGTKKELQISTTYSPNQVSKTYRYEHVPRARVNDLHYVSQNNNLNILQISGANSGYAKFRGTPFIAHADYHISAKEFDRRKNLPWPTDLPGMLVSKEYHEPAPAPDKSKRRRNAPHQQGPGKPLFDTFDFDSDSADADKSGDSTADDDFGDDLFS